jgi:RHS repeat-associated protein
VYVSGSPTREGFTGYELDAETGLNYAGARYYMPALGRFTSTDRFKEMYPSLSPYQYAANNPISVIDVNGDSLNVHSDEGGISRFFKRLFGISTRADRAVGAMNQGFSGISLSRDRSSGSVSVSGTPADAREQGVYDAVTSSSVTVNLNVVGSNRVTSQDGSNQPLRVGLFDGSVQRADGVVVAQQFVNLSQASTFADVTGVSVGATVTHEVNEAFAGASNGPGLYSSARFNAAHLIATGLDPPSNISNYQIVPVRPGGGAVTGMVIMSGGVQIRVLWHD